MEPKTTPGETRVAKVPEGTPSQLCWLLVKSLSVGASVYRGRDVGSSFCSATIAHRSDGAADQPGEVATGLGVSVGVDQPGQCQVPLGNLQLVKIECFGAGGFEPVQHRSEDAATRLGQ